MRTEAVSRRSRDFASGPQKRPTPRPEPGVGRTTRFCALVLAAPDRVAPRAAVAGIVAGAPDDGVVARAAADVVVASAPAQTIGARATLEGVIAAAAASGVVARAASDGVV